MRSRRKVFLLIFIPFFVFLAGVLAFGLYRMLGRSSLDSHAEALRVIRLEEGEEEDEEILPESGQILYNGNIYEYNDDLLTFLCLGVDSRQDIQLEKTPGKGGQADTIILAVMDTARKTLKLINVSRDTLAKIKVYDTNGIYLYEEEAQLALQYAYGDGGEGSCLLMEQAVSNLFYGIPIHGYGAIDVKAVADLNDAVGGVEVTVIEDLSRFTPDLALGNTLTLTGRQALHYVQERDVETEELGANNLRIERQKQYLQAFWKTVKAKTKQDLTLPLRLYNTAASHMVTSITADQVAYLSTIALDCTFSDEDMLTVQGTVRKEDVYEEFLVDEEALYDLIIQVFYREVERQG